MGAGQPHKLIRYIGGDFLLYEKENLKHFIYTYFTNLYKYLYLYHENKKSIKIKNVKIDILYVINIV